MKDRSILAYFGSEGEASAAVSELTNHGYGTVQLDRISLLPGETSDDAASPLTGDFNSLANLTLGTEDLTDSEGVLLAAHPAASGLAEAEMPRSTPFLVTVVCPEQRVDEAVKILKRHGARV